MYIKVTASAFINAFRNMSRDNHFGSNGLYALYDYLEEIERESDQQIELDVIALCCDFVRFESLTQYNRAYGTDYMDARDIECFACSIGKGPAFICHAH